MLSYSLFNSKSPREDGKNTIIIRQKIIDISYSNGHNLLRICILEFLDLLDLDF